MGANKYFKTWHTDQVSLAKQGKRKLRQDMHKPMVIADKKKQASKLACRNKGAVKVK